MQVGQFRMYGALHNGSEVKRQKKTLRLINIYSLQQR